MTKAQDLTQLALALHVGSTHLPQLDELSAKAGHALVYIIRFYYLPDISKWLAEGEGSSQLISSAQLDTVLIEAHEHGYRVLLSDRQTGKPVRQW